MNVFEGILSYLIGHAIIVSLTTLWKVFQEASRCYERDQIREEAVEKLTNVFESYHAEAQKMGRKFQKCLEDEKLRMEKEMEKGIVLAPSPDPIRTLKTKEELDKSIEDKLSLFVRKEVEKCKNVLSSDSVTEKTIRDMTPSQIREVLNGKSKSNEIIRITARETGISLHKLLLDKVDAKKKTETEKTETEKTETEKTETETETETETYSEEDYARCLAAADYTNPDVAEDGNCLFSSIEMLIGKKEYSAAALRTLAFLNYEHYQDEILGGKLAKYTREIGAPTVNDEDYACIGQSGRSVPFWTPDLLSHCMGKSIIVFDKRTKKLARHQNDLSRLPKGNLEDGLCLFYTPPVADIGSVGHYTPIVFK